MTKQTGKPDKYRSRAQAAAAWWRALSGNLPDDETEDRRRRADTGAMARLRRCATPIEAAAEPAFIDLFRRLYPKSGADPNKLEGLAVAAILLAHLRSEPHPGASLPARLGRTREGKIPKEGEIPLFSAARMRALVRPQNHEDVLRGFRNAIAILGRDNVPVADLAFYAIHWLHPTRGEEFRVRFLFDYHQAGAATPDADPQDSNTGDSPT